MKVQNSKHPATLAEVCDQLEQLAPTSLAQAWDNVGLLAGDRRAPIRRVLLCIDLTPEVAAEAIGAADRKKSTSAPRADLIVAYHPPIFKPISRLTAPGHDTSAIVHQCVRAGAAIYSTHTALDAADGGTNDCMARLCGVEKTWPLEYVGGIEDGQCKVVVFTPAAAVEKVAAAMFAAGAGWIGDYEKCSFRIPGTGTFRGTESTHPVIGEAGRFETVDEVRLESVTPRRAVPAVVEAIRASHPYEEPAFDIYPLQSVPRRGIGRYGDLPRPISLAALAKRLRKATGARCVQIVGEAERTVSRAVICVGSAGSLPFKIGLTQRDVIVTGEIRHHDALDIQRRGCSAIALGHWTSERPVLEPFAAALRDRVKGIEVSVSQADRDPFGVV